MMVKSAIPEACIKAANLCDDTIPLIPYSSPAYELDLRNKRRARRVILALAECVSDEMIEAFDAAVAEWNHPKLKEAKRAGLRAALIRIAGGQP